MKNYKVIEKRLFGFIRQSLALHSSRKTVGMLLNSVHAVILPFQEKILQKSEASHHGGYVRGITNNLGRITSEEFPEIMMG